MRRLIQRWAPATVAGALLAVASVATASPSSAATYRYWSYWLASGSGWTYSSWGPASLTPADGSVEGWRFGMGEGTSGAGLSPRSAPDFDRICAGTPASEGTKRVAIIIDPGLADHAPDGEFPAGAWAMCVTAPPKATGFDILREAASVRTQQGMVCGLAGYPARECAVIVDTPSTAPSPTPTASPSPTKESSRPTPRPTSNSPSTTASTETSSGATPAASSEASASAAQPNPTEEPATDTDALLTPSTTTAPGRSDVRPTPASESRSISNTPGTAAALPAPTVTPSPDLTIVSATVADPNSGPGPAMAIIGIGAIAVIGALALLRRRSTR